MRNAYRCKEMLALSKTITGVKDLSAFIWFVWYVDMKNDDYMWPGTGYDSSAFAYWMSRNQKTIDIMKAVEHLTPTSIFSAEKEKDSIIRECGVTGYCYWRLFKNIAEKLEMECNMDEKSLGRSDTRFIAQTIEHGIYPHAPYEEDEIAPYLTVHRRELYYTGVILFTLLRALKESEKKLMSSHPGKPSVTQPETKSAKKEAWSKLKELQKELEAEKERLKSANNKIDQLNKVILTSDAEITHRCADENRELKGKLDNLTAKYEEEKAQRELLEAALDALASEEEFAARDDSLSHLDAHALIASHRVVIIGGQTNWRNKMKLEFPSLLLVDDNDKFDITPLTTADLIVVIAAHMSHKAFYRIRPILRQKGAHYTFLATTAIETSGRRIAEALDRIPV